MNTSPHPPLDVLIIGGGMIVNDQLLPSLYHLQRIGTIGEIHICARHNAPLRELLKNRTFQEAFPGQRFIPHPPLAVPANRFQPDAWRKTLAAMKPRQAVVVAVPDQFHYPVVMEALAHHQHVLCVKPLVLKYRQAIEIERRARARGLLVAVEYHKRFDRRSLVARKEYAAGHFGEFRLGQAKLIEPYYYRHSNFQNWFTCDQTDPFVYVGCHYVDLVYFITGLRPVGVSVQGVKGRFPNGTRAYLWANGRVEFENGALLSVLAGLGYPDDGAGSNDQALQMFCEGKGRSGLIDHNDQNRGIQYSYLTDRGPGGTAFNYVSPDYLRFVPWEGRGFKPIGYGYDSVAAAIETMVRIEAETADWNPRTALRQRQMMLTKVDRQGLIATPANSFINELVQEAARMSILRDGRTVRIVYGKSPRVKC